MITTIERRRKERTLPKCKCGATLSRMRQLGNVTTCPACDPAESAYEPADGVSTVPHTPVEVLTAALDALKANHQWRQDYDDHDGYPDSELCKTNMDAIRALELQLAELAKSMMIVDTDNFGGDYPNEKVVAAFIGSEKQAKLMAKGLNDVTGGDAPRYYKVVNADYKLQPGFEP